MKPDVLSIEAGFEHACDLLRQSLPVAVPTETVYGLAGLANSGDAITAIYKAKDRPMFNPLIVHVANMAMAREVADFSDLAERLASAFWPGPLTLVLPLAQNAPVHPLALAGLDSVAIRMPRGPMAKLASALNGALVAPSANPSGRISATTAQDVAKGLAGRIDLVLDDGPSQVGVESTIIKLDGDQPVLLRAGGLAVENIEVSIGVTIIRPLKNGAIIAPGMLASHYAPHAKMRLNVTKPLSGEAYLGFGKCSRDDAHSENLSETGDLAEAAQNLFAMLHRLDALGFETIGVAPIPNQGLGEAINDRLMRAAAPRDEG